MVLAGGWLLFGQGDERPDSSAGQAQAGREKPARAKPGEESRRNSDSPAGQSKKPVLTRSTCPPELANCVAASGRVIYVEAVDPDGDGDAHFVTTSEQGVTLPGVTIFDVREDLRPEPLPGVGDLVGGAGPVYTGSRGQQQIEVIEFHVAR